MSSFRTSSVFRFTKEFESLKKIIRDGIIPNYCEEDLSFENTDFVVGIPMSSFCDIPITLLDEHNNRYGKYGIAISKEWAIKNGLTPIIYTANDDVLRSVFHYYERNKKILDWYNREDVKNRMINDTVLKGFPLEDYATILDAKIEHAMNTHIIGYMKKYEGEYQKKPINNYEENEWRYLVPDKGETTWFWTKEAYMAWRFPTGNMEAKKPAPKPALKKYTLRYNNNDLSYILVKDEEYKEKVIAFIKELKTIGGNIVTDKKQKDDMISKIITLDQVKRDF